ncbi:potassium channel family protein [Companilactobacillus hulinensis]|uniref:potassium channel family protein n=1 Tax=Companilactobacillus hulinensis TaxID=2486007 RepID=UPI000F76775A|nr:potassium channel family protein [Companilactobacillus hulinensis]
MKTYNNILNNKKLRIAYYVVIIASGLLSLITLVLSFIPSIDVNKLPYNLIDITTLTIFTIDYFTRWILAKDKLVFFRKNIFDLLAIIPFYSIFSFFRVFRVFRVFQALKVFALLRFMGTAGKLQKHFKKFLKINGLIYLFIVCTIVLITAAIMYSMAEGVSLGESFWWAIVTASTVGYGDIAPTTLVGKIASSLLMIVGIGFVSTLTSTITNYFTPETNSQSNEKLDQIIVKLDTLSQENKELHHEIDNLKEKLHENS